MKSTIWMKLATRRWKKMRVRRVRWEYCCFYCLILIFLLLLLSLFFFFCSAYSSHFLQLHLWTLLFQEEQTHSLIALNSGGTSSDCFFVGEERIRRILKFDAAVWCTFTNRPPSDLEKQVSLLFFVLANTCTHPAFTYLLKFLFFTFSLSVYSTTFSIFSFSFSSSYILWSRNWDCCAL